MENTDPHPPITALDRYAKQTSGKVFLIGTSVQMLIYLVTGMAILFYQYSQMRYWRDKSFWEWVQREDLDQIVMLCILSGLVYMLASFFMGRWVGPKIIANKYAFTWVPALAMLLPAFVGGLFMTCMVVWTLLRPRELDDPNFVKQFILATSFFSAAAYAPCIVFSPLCGLSVRQLCRMRHDKTAKLERELGVKESRPEGEKTGSPLTYGNAPH